MTPLTHAAERSSTLRDFFRGVVVPVTFSAIMLATIVSAVFYLTPERSKDD